MAVLTAFIVAFLVATFTKGHDTACDDEWVPTYDHPLLHPAAPPDGADPLERRGYTIGLFENPTFPPTLHGYDTVLTFHNLQPGSIKEGGLFRAVNEKRQRMVLFARRMFGFDKNYAAFELGIIDETGKSVLCMCDIGGTEVTESMAKDIKAGDAAVPRPFWNAVVRCDVRPMTFIKGMTMEEVERQRREISWGIRKIPIS